MRALAVLPLVAGCGAVSIDVAKPAPRSLASAPEFTLPSPRGDVALRDVLANGPALLVFYRGFW